jgi:hypothetical protein
MAIRKAPIALSPFAGGMFAVCLILITILFQGTAAQQVPRRDNTWAARSSSGQTLGGTWTVIEYLKSGGVTGSWTLLDAQGRMLATGGWSAARSPAGWTGSWLAAAGQAGEFTGTWTAKLDLKPAAGFRDLFAKAVEAAVSGTWRSGPRSGAWTIQVFN